MKVSILVAVYNGEQYLERSLRSLLAQSYEDIEVVCIDDGSTDGSVEVIRRFMNDSRVRLVRLDGNHGAAEARNAGLEVCTGDIIGFLDCDDWYSEDTVQRLVDVFLAHDDADCVQYRCLYVDADGREHDFQGVAFESMPGVEAFRESLTWNIHGVYAARTELYRRFQFDTTRKHFSDDNTTRLHYYLSRRVYQSDAPYYYYQNPNSISHQISTSRMDYLAATQSMKRHLIGLGCDADVLALYEEQRVKVLVDCYLFYYKYRHQLSDADKSYCLKELRQDWETIDTNMIKGCIKYKFGYCVFPHHWHLFRLQEELYFLLKRLTRRL